jgi:hypothetical protein
MADSKEEILYQLKIEENRALRSLTKVKEGVKTLDRRTTKYKETVKEQIRLESQLASIRKQRIQVNKGVEKSVKDLTKAQVQKKNAVGASTSATLELGRVLSDMPYGIRGVANNLQQLASNLFFMSKATDAATGKAVGFGGAISRLLGGLIGPAGILIAFQGVIALLDYFKVGMSSAKDETNEAEKATKDFSSSLKSLEKTLIDSGVSQEAYNGKIREYIALKKLEKKVEESILSTQSEINKKNEESAKTKKNDIKLEEDLLKARKASVDEANRVYEDSATGRKAKAQAIDYSITIEQIESKLRNNIIVRKKLEEDVIKLTKDGIDEITKLEKAKKNLAKAEKGTLKFYKQQKSDLEKIRQASAKTSEEYIKQGIAIEEIQKLIEAIEGKDNGDVFKGKFIESYYREIAGLEDVVKDEDFDGISDSAKITGTIILKPKIDNPDPEEIDKISEFISNYKTLMSGLTDFIDGEFERELTIEQNKTNVLNKELNDRLINETLSAEQRKNIQNQIAQNDENLRVKQDAIARKKFKTAKAFNISMAVADTYLAGVRVLADPSFVGRPFARGIAMAATIASGLASVAAISRQKFQSSSAATPINTGGGGASGGAGGSERSEPSFNIVGRSNENLLINAIQAQFGKPLKAYVVSRDVTTQQQLDGMIVGQAGT